MEAQTLNDTVAAISKKRLDGFILDARAFITYGVEHHLSNTAILSNLSHDIFGLAKGDKLMLPRVTGYEKQYPFNKSEMFQNHLGFGTQFHGSSLGVLLPLLNTKTTNKPAGRVETAPHIGNRENDK